MSYCQDKGEKGTAQAGHRRALLQDISIAPNRFHNKGTITLIVDTP